MKLYYLLPVMLFSCSSLDEQYPRQDTCPSWANSIYNPENEEFVIEVAFNLGIDPSDVTQEQFDERYGND